MQIGDPPESKRKPSDHWVNVVRKLKSEYPNQYGMVGNYSVGVATHIRDGDYPAFLPAVPVPDKRAYVRSHWDVTTRRTPDGRNDVYVKWTGDGCECGACREQGQ